MDTRSLIKFGRNSYAVTLPLTWIKKESLGKGSLLYLEENHEGLVVSSISKANKRQIQKIDMDVTGKEIPRVKRELVSHYINGYDVIKIRGKDLAKKANEIREMIHRLVALEVIEQTSSQITARAFLSPRSASVSQLIRKVDIINRNMMQDLMSETVDYTDISQRDKDIDRLIFLILRIIKYNLMDTSSNRVANLSNSELLYYWNTAYFLESIADRITSLSPLLSNLSKDKAVFRNILGVYKEAVQAYVGIMNAYHSKDAEKAYKLSIGKEAIIQHCDSLYEKHWNKKGVVKALENIKDIALITHSICRRVYS